ncbi:hypothetical protein QJS10_CPB04g00232 [Acorus calamus]|uniref:TF-B3 domain-containing protein n=1 Tax=Acorus calamus TaxID=4465 RepID=A0AAV9F119_ACOCL|nr:hypothetical protein QJS10_CPB04g00232 [Acorus calamus]
MKPKRATALEEIRRDPEGHRGFIILTLQTLLQIHPNPPPQTTLHNNHTTSHDLLNFLETLLEDKHLKHILLEEKEKPPKKATEAVGVPAWVVERVRTEGGYGLRYVAAKKLTKTDVNGHHRRLQLPKAAMEGFMREELREEEVREVMGEKSKGLGVRVYDRLGYVHGIRLQYWGCNGYYTLCGVGWMEVVEAYGIQSEDVKEKDLVANVWSFRRRDGGGGGEERVGKLVLAVDVVAC